MFEQLKELTTNPAALVFTLGTTLLVFVVTHYLRGYLAEKGKRRVSKEQESSEDRLGSVPVGQSTVLIEISSTLRGISDRISHLEKLQILEEPDVEELIQFVRTKADYYTLQSEVVERPHSGLEIIFTPRLSTSILSHAHQLSVLRHLKGRVMPRRILPGRESSIQREFDRLYEVYIRRAEELQRAVRHGEKKLLVVFSHDSTREYFRALSVEERIEAIRPISGLYETGNLLLRVLKNELYGLDRDMASFALVIPGADNFTIPSIRQVDSAWIAYADQPTTRSSNRESGVRGRNSAELTDRFDLLMDHVERAAECSLGELNEILELPRF